jgi:hypothetical protein
MRHFFLNSIDNDADAEHDNGDQHMTADNDSWLAEVTFDAPPMRNSHRSIDDHGNNVGK